MKYIIDRVIDGKSGRIAVCEDEEKKLHPFRVTDLPFEPKEGMAFEHEDGRHRIIPNPHSERVAELMQRLIKRR